MEDDDDSIDASPTELSDSGFKRSKRVRRKKARTVANTNEASTGMLRQCGNTSKQSELDLHEERLFEADRLDCLRAQQEPVRQRSVPASQNFCSLQSLLEEQQMTLAEAEPKPEIDKPLSRTPADIVQEILEDFCASPNYVEEEEELPTYDAPPWFRFRGKKIKTFCHKRPIKSATTSDDEDDDRLSCCSSELSVQEDFITQMPTRTHCAFDVNSSQKICENLLNLSAFFTQNNVNKSIDLPETELKDCTLIEIVECAEEDATDVLEEMGYLIGNTEQCKYLDDNCDIKDNAEFSLFNLPVGDTPSKADDPLNTNLCGDWFNAEFSTQKCATKETKEAKKVEIPTLKASLQETSDIELLEGIPLSEWQPMDIADAAGKQDKDVQESNINAISDCNQLKLIAFSEWQPMEIPDVNDDRNKTIEIPAENRQKEEMLNDLSENIQFRTALNKTLKLSEEMQTRAAMLLADLETVDTTTQLEAQKDDKQLDMFGGFRTASNKTIELTEQMQKAAENLMADLETNVPNGEEFTTDCEMLAGIPLSEWQPMDLPDMESNKASNQNAQVDADICSQLDTIPFSEWQPMDIADASNKVEEATKLMADLAASYSQQIVKTENDLNSVSENAEKIEFRTASNKTMKLSEEMQKRAAMLMADLESVHQQETATDSKEYLPRISSESECCTISKKIIQISEEKQKEADLKGSYSQTESVGFDETSDKIQFRTASNKVMKLTEEMRKRAAMLMADLESVHQQETATDSTEYLPRISSESELCTSSKKTFQISEKQKEIVKLMTDLKGSYSQTARVHFDEASDKIQFRTASNKVMKLTEEMRKRAAMLMADLEADTADPQEAAEDQLNKIQLKGSSPKHISNTATSSEKQLREDTITVAIDGITPFKPEIKVVPLTATPQQPKLGSAMSSAIVEGPFETPKCTPELQSSSQSSLTQLSERSPLDRATKSSIITRRNLLSLNKRRKQKRDAENCSVDAGQTPMRQRFAPTPASTSTPMPDRKEMVKEDSPRMMRDRSCSQESPRVQRERVGKRKSEDALSPIYAPTNKTRRLGLSRIRNKSSHDI